MEHHIPVQQPRSLPTLAIMRVCCVVCVVALFSYVYLAFSTTALVAQHRGLEMHLAELTTDRSASEYAFHSASETLFAQNAGVGLAEPETISFISLSTTTNVAFAQVE